MLNRVVVHPELSHNGLQMDGALVAVGSLWPVWCPKNKSQTYC